MPSLFQTLDMDDEPLTWWSSSSRMGREPDLNVEEVYCESHRLAIEQLITVGVDAYLEFLKKERVRNFLSEDEIKFILQSAAVPKCTPQSGNSGAFVLSEATSLAYFPDVSDVAAPSLDIGWHAFSPDSVPGETTATAHFQPNFSPYTPVKSIYSCKVAARKMIKEAKEVIAIVTDSFTDVDIFQDLQEACTRRRVPVYILLDHEAVRPFLQMCSNINVRLAELQKMRVRAVTGFRFFTRTGAHVTGRIHEQFMLVDGTKVAMGTYRFKWTDGRINTCNMIELTGEVVNKYEQEFQRLHKKSLAVNIRAVLPPQAPQASTLKPICLNIAPSRAQALGVVLSSVTPAAKVTSPPANPSAALGHSACHTSTQTSSQCVTQGTQTGAIIAHQPRIALCSTSSAEADSSGSESACTTPTETSSVMQTIASLSVNPCPTPTPSILTLTGHSRSKELQQQPQKWYYPPPSTLSSLCNKKDSMGFSSPSLRSVSQWGCKAQQSTRPGPGLTMGSMLMAMPMRSRFQQ